MAYRYRSWRTRCVTCPDRITGITLPAYPQMIDGTSYVLADPAADDFYRALRESRPRPGQPTIRTGLND